MRKKTDPHEKAKQQQDKKRRAYQRIGYTPDIVLWFCVVLAACIGLFVFGRHYL